jgi:hypothetical protein
MKAQIGYNSTLSSTSALYGSGLLTSRLTTGNNPLYRRLGGPHGRTGRVEKILPPPGYEPQVVEPVACRYTDLTIPTIPAYRSPKYNCSNKRIRRKTQSSHQQTTCSTLSFLHLRPANQPISTVVAHRGGTSLLYKFLDKHIGFGTVIYSILYYPCACHKPVAIIHALLHGDTKPPTVIDINRQQSRLILIYRSFLNYCS